MSASSFLQNLTNVLFLGIFIVALVSLARRRTRVNIDIALFFGVAALVIVESWILQVLDLPSYRLLSALTGTLLLAMPYLLLRLLNDVTIVPPIVLRLVEAGLAISVVLVFALRSPLPDLVTLAIVAYFSAVLFYSALVVVRVARSSGGVTRRRAQAIAVGSICLALAILSIGLSAVLSLPETLEAILFAVLALGSGLSYFVAFATPRFLRNAWQEPELRAFLAQAARLPRLPDTASIVAELERGARTSVGAPWSVIGILEQETGRLRFPTGNDAGGIDADRTIAGRAFTTQRAIYSANAVEDDPESAEIYRAYGANAVMAAPITAGERRLGVLTVYAPRAPIFAEDDLTLVQLLADQAAVILESRTLIDEAARVRAQEEATRLKDDFLSAAAHDLKTPLTALVMQAQLLERRAITNPSAPVDLEAIRRVIEQARRLRGLVLELLDASRVEHGKLSLTLEEADLTEITAEVLRVVPIDRHQVSFEHNGAVVGVFDRNRIAQVVENLIENAAKYSPDSTDIAVRVWREGDEAHLSVSDSGIGIPPDDLSRVFERFHRGGNVDDRRFLGMGLGLYICRGIVEQHAGQISATSEPGRGSTFHVVLPVTHTAVVESAPTDLSR